MLRRFREHAARQDWFAVGVDVAIVVVGVFLGTQANNWNQARLDRDRGRKDRAMLIDDLRSNQANLEMRRRYYVWVRDEALKTLAALDRPSAALGTDFLVDAYQATGQIPTDVKDADVDFLLAGGLKWLLGGPGIVFSYVRRDLIPQLAPTISGWFGTQNQFAFDIHALDYPDTAMRFEQGTPALAPVYALLGGLSYIHEIGPPTLRERTQHLTEDLIARALAAGFEPRVAADPARRSGIVLLNMADPRPVVAALAQAGTIVDSRPGAVRVSPYFYNTIEENAIVIDAMVRIRDGGGV